jgi:hypothetical protein
MLHHCSQGSKGNENDSDPCRSGKDDADQIGECDTPHGPAIILLKPQYPRRRALFSPAMEAGGWNSE